MEFQLNPFSLQAYLLWPSSLTDNASGTFVLCSESLVHVPVVGKELFVFLWQQKEG